MALPPWTIELLRRSLSDVASKAHPETLERLKSQATAILNDLPAAAAGAVDSVMAATESKRDAVRTWARSHTARSTAVINASGTLFSGGSGLPVGIPMDADVIQSAMEFLDGSRLPGPGMERLEQTVLARLAGPVSTASMGIAICNRLESAVALIPTLIGELPLWLHRSQAIAVPPPSGRSIPDLISALGFAFSEIGSTAGPAESDYAVSGGLHSGSSSSKSVATVMADTGTGTPAERLIVGGLRIDVLPIATLKSSTAGLSSVQSSLAAGADVVILGAGLIGGPATGIVVGDMASIDRMKSHPLWSLLRAADVDAAMTLAAASRDPLEVADSAASLMKIGEDNLRARAERLATRLGGHDAIASCQITDHPARVSAGLSFEIPSRQVKIKPSDHSVDQVVARLKRQDPAVWVAADGGGYSIDLRWVPPAEDAVLAGAVLGEKSAAT